MVSPTFIIHRGDIMSTSGDIMSTSGGYHEYIGGYHEYIGGYHDTDVGAYHDKCGGYHEYIGGCSVHRGYHPDVLMVSPTFIMICPHISIMISPDVLNIPRCTHDIPDVLMVSLRCTEHPSMYSWYPSDVLNTPDVLMISPRYTHSIPPMY